MQSWAHLPFHCTLITQQVLPEQLHGNPPEMWPCIRRWAAFVEPGSYAPHNADPGAHMSLLTWKAEIVNKDKQEVWYPKLNTFSWKEVKLWGQYISVVKVIKNGPGKMALLLWALFTFVEYLGSVLKPHMAAHKIQGIRWPLLTSMGPKYVYDMQTYMQAKTYTNKFKIICFYNRKI